MIGIFGRLMAAVAAPLPAPVAIAALGQPILAMVTPGLLRALACVDPEGWAPILASHAARAGITTPRRLAMFLANAAHESGRLRRLEESLDYDARVLVTQFGPHRITPEQAAQVGRVLGRPANQEALANIVYGGAWGREELGNAEPGDGWRWRGRGLLQTTGRTNYTTLAKAVGRPLEDLPEWLRSRDGAAESACLFWAARGCNAAADAGQLRQVRILINGGVNGLAEVEELYRLATVFMGAR